MMPWAGAAGVDVPETRPRPDSSIVTRSINGLPPNVWPGREQWAYAVRRFDRDDGRRLVHIEDLAQVRNFYPQDKYRGNLETVASLAYQSRNMVALREFARRLAFIVLIGNGDAHLKNWSLIYRNPQIPTLAPAYDLVSTTMYRVGPGEEDLGLTFGGSRRFDRVSLALFQRLEDRLDATGANLVGEVEELVARARQEWVRCAGC